MSGESRLFVHKVVAGIDEEEEEDLRTMGLLFDAQKVGSGTKGRLVLDRRNNGEATEERTRSRSGRRRDRENGGFTRVGHEALIPARPRIGWRSRTIRRTGRAAVGPS